MGPVSLIRRELNNQGFDGVVTEEVIRQGKKAEEILKQIDEDDASPSTEATGPVPSSPPSPEGRRPADLQSP
jgi:hypothetical protein